MGIYIEGMDMPTEYGRCMVIFSDGRVTTEFGSQVIANAVPVPPHGRLIDANRIGLTGVEMLLCQTGNRYKNALEMLLEKIESAPAIIPAELPKETDNG